jgi:molecular chaperone DnaK (HSP70)
MGAAIRGAIIDGRRPDLSVADITSHTLAIERAGDVAAIIFQKGTSFPTDAKTEVRFTITNETQDQKQLSIRVIQGEAHRASVCEVLARAAIPIEPGAPQSARVPLVARLDVSGRPTVICGDVEVYGGGP